MQFITLDQRIAVENFEVGLIYTVTFSNGDSFTGACIGIGPDFVAFQRTAPKLLFCLTMTTAADVASIDPLGNDIGKILTYTGTVPVSIKTDGSPLLDYLITGNTIQNGTPTPDNPIIPQGTGERTGNLFDNTILQNGYSLNATSGLPTAYAARCATYTPIDVADFDSVTLTYNTDLPTPNFMYSTFDSNDELIERVTGKTSGNSINVSTASKLYIAFYRTGTIANTDFSEIMLNLGSTALPYEPYGYKIPISSANTSTPVYLGEVETTRKIKKLVFDGRESWNEDTSNYYIFIDISGRGSGIPNSTALSTHTESGVVVNNNGAALFFKKSVFVHSSLADFKAYLAQQYTAGTPVTVWYVLATEETAVVNEPLCKIDVYADTLSYRQSGVNIPTTDGLDIFDIDTTVKPSEVYLKYFSPLF